MINKSRFTTTYILGGALFILLIVMFLLRDPLGILRQENNTPFVEPFNEEDITKIEITSPDLSETVEKIEGEWKVVSKDSVKADTAIVEALLKKAEQLKRGEIASKNKEKQAVFQVDESGVHIKLFAGETKKADFYIGKLGPQFSSTYIRKEGEDLVYLFNENLKPIFNRREYRDLSILSFDKTKVEKIKIEAEDSLLTLEKTGDTWKVSEPLNFEIQEEKIQPTLSILSSLRAKDIKTDIDEKGAGLDKPSLKITISQREEEEKILLVGNKTSDEENADYYAKLETNPTIYVVRNATVSNFPTKISDLEKDE